MVGTLDWPARPQIRAVSWTRRWAPRGSVKPGEPRWLDLGTDGLWNYLAGAKPEVVAARTSGLKEFCQHRTNMCAIRHPPILEQGGAEGPTQSWSRTCLITAPAVRARITRSPPTDQFSM
jgi:hypothetical protein